MLLTEEDKNIIVNNRKPTVDINDKKYFVKIGAFQQDGVSLVVEELAKHVGITSAHIERTQIDGISYYLSEDLNGDEVTRFEPAMYAIRFGHTLNEMCDALQDHYPNQAVFLIDKVIKMYIFDSLVMNIDRNYSNWGFLYDGDRITDLVILDNEYCFLPSSVIPMRFSDSYIGRREDLFEFLDTSSFYYREMLKEMYSILTPELVTETFAMVEKNNDMRIPLKDIFLRNYAYNYGLIGEKLRGINK